MTNGEKLDQIFPDGICPFSQNWLKTEYKNPNREITTGSIIDWNNCHTSEQLESISTTKNDLGVDCISRQAVLDLINADWKYEGLEIEINNLPTVTPIRPKGHWIPIYQGDEIIGYRCSECEFGNTFGKGTIGMNYCPNCGADMREVEE